MNTWGYLIFIAALLLVAALMLYARFASRSREKSLHHGVADIPAPDELMDEPLAAWILEHTIDLSSEYVRIGQLSGFGMLKQGRIRLRRPEEVRQTRRQIVTVERSLPLLHVDE